MVHSENNHLMNVLFSFADNLSLFLSVWIIFSLWAGYTLGIGWAVPLSAMVFVLALFYFRKKWFTHDDSSAFFSNYSAWAVVFLSLFLVGVLGYVFWTMQGGYDLSADATPSVAAKFIQTTIPATYAPYFDVPFFYQPGVPMITSQLHRWIGIPVHASGWALGMLGIILLLFASARLAVWASGKKEALFFVAALWVGARLIFVDLLVGEYPLLLALGLSLTAIIALRDRPVLSAILFAGAGIVHPYIAGIFFVSALFIHRPTISTLRGMTLLGLLSVLPLLLFMFGPAILNGGSSALSGGLSIESFVRTLSPLPIFLGVIPLAAIFYFRLVRASNFDANPILKRIEFLSLAGVILYIFFANFFPVLLLHSKFLEAAALFTIIFASVLLSRFIPTKRIVPVLIVIFLAGALLTFSSNDLSRLAHGSKTGIREAAFSEWFGKKEPTPGRTIFFARGPGKMAQYSNQIPVDATSANFTLALHLFSRLPDAKAHLEETLLVREAVASECFSCIEKIPYDYLVVDTRAYSHPPAWVPDYYFDDFAVFIKR